MDELLVAVSRSQERLDAVLPKLSIARHDREVARHCLQERREAASLAARDGFYVELPTTTLQSVEDDADESRVAFEYSGCLINYGRGRLEGHQWHVSIQACALRSYHMDRNVSMQYFGMENPHCCEGDFAACLLLPGLSVNNTTKGGTTEFAALGAKLDLPVAPDADCLDARSSRVVGRRLGGERRLSVYRVLSPA